MTESANGNAPGKQYCNCLAQSRGLDPGGHAHGFRDAMVVETALPWRLDMMQKAGPLPQQMIDLLGVWLQEYKEGKPHSHLPMAIAPDQEYSCPGFRRIMLYTRPAGLMSRFDKVEYLVPECEAGALIWSLYQDRNWRPFCAHCRWKGMGRDSCWLGGYCLGTACHVGSYGGRIQPER